MQVRPTEGGVCRDWGATALVPGTSRIRAGNHGGKSKRKTTLGTSKEPDLTFKELREVLEYLMKPFLFFFFLNKIEPFRDCMLTVKKQSRGHTVLLLDFCLENVHTPPSKK